MGARICSKGGKKSSTFEDAISQGKEDTGIKTAKINHAHLINESVGQQSLLLI